MTPAGTAAANTAAARSGTTRWNGRSGGANRIQYAPVSNSHWTGSTRISRLSR